MCSPVFAVQQSDQVLVCPWSWHINHYRQCLWKFLFTRIFYYQSVIPRGGQTSLQLDANLQQKVETVEIWIVLQFISSVHDRTWLSYIIATADGHVRVAWSDLLSWAGSWQVVVTTAAGIVARDGGEGVQREIPVQQTTTDTQTDLREGRLKTRQLFSLFSPFFPKIFHCAYFWLASGTGL